MRITRCGTSDLHLPALGVGCWAYGGGEYWGAQSQQDVQAVVRAAVERGYGFFDTAEVYNAGASEASLGSALRDIPREHVTICTKISPLQVAKKRVAECCEASLQRLGLDYIDLYMVHWPVTARSIRHFGEESPPIPPIEEVFESIDRLRRAGKIRHIGVSNFGTERLSEALSIGIPIVANELPYGLLNRAIEHDVLPFCRSLGIGVIGYMALLQGALSDRYSSPADLPACRRRSRHFNSANNPLCRHGTGGAEKETADAVMRIRAVARQLETSTADLALRWVMQRTGIACCLCGSRDVTALQENIRAAEGPPLPEAALEELDRITQPLLHVLGPSFDYYEHSSNDRTK